MFENQTFPYGDHLEIYSLLGVNIGAAMEVKNMLLEQWGMQFIIKFLVMDDDPDVWKQLALTFEDCTKIAWDVFGEFDPQETGSEVIAIHLGKKDDQKSMLIVTRMFEVALVYNDLKIEKDW